MPIRALVELETASIGRSWARLRPATPVWALLLLVALAVPARAHESAISRGDMADYSMVFPVKGEARFEDTFGAPRTGHTHEGQDLFAAKGTPVVAVADGTVRFVNWSGAADLNPARCCSVVVDHSDGWQSRYLHLDNDTPCTDDGKGWGIAKGIAPGVEVSAGQLIGWVGDSGNAEDTPSHVHFELRAPGDVVTNAYQALLTATPALAVGPLFTGTTLVRSGARGGSVSHLQEVLAAVGHDAGPADGIFGPATLAAVVSFQEALGLDADGIVGAATRGALLARLAPQATAPEAAPAAPSSGQTPVVRIGDRGAAVTRLQELLGAGGFGPGPADGIFGPLTESAVRAFQTDRSLVIDGIVGRQTWSALFTG